MAHAFKNIPGKPAFGTLKQVTHQSDYLERKKAQRTVCTSQANCGQIKNAKSYAEVNQYNEGFRSNKAKGCNELPFNKSDLIVNLYSKMDLQDACTMINGFPCIDPELSEIECSESTIPTCCSNACSGTKTISVNSTNPFNWNNTIDPVGELFGNTKCGIENFTHYMTLSQPSTTNNLVDISSAATANVFTTFSNNLNNDSSGGSGGEVDPQLLQASLFSINTATNQALASINSMMFSATNTISSTTDQSVSSINNQIVTATNTISSTADQSVAAINDQLFSATSMMSATTEQSVATINEQISTATSTISSTTDQSVSAINEQLFSATGMMSSTTDQSVAAINNQLFSATSMISSTTDQSVSAINDQMVSATSAISLTADQSVESINDSAYNAYTNINNFTSNSSAALNEQLLQAMSGISTTQEELITMLTLLINSNLSNATTNINAVTAEAINNINIHAYNALGGGSGDFNNEQLIQISNNLLNKINYLFETFFHADSVTIIENYPLTN